MSKEEKAAIRRAVALEKLVAAIEKKVFGAKQEGLLMQRVKSIELKTNLEIPEEEESSLATRVAFIYKKFILRSSPKTTSGETDSPF